ncbi:MAG: hypothetical protein KJO07_25990 [Deltaproteobacteria bacterium]|nr:hypothetical protein [Deltaproteobacteria bacterium]
MPRRIAAVLCLLALCLATYPAAAESTPSVNAELIAYYGKSRSYRRVRRDVLSWHKTTRNGCVAFVSTALRHIGYDIPQRGKLDGWGVSRITFAFSAHLENAGWTRSNDVAGLRPGDIVFTQGYPDHVFVFHSWASERRRIARVIDNKGLRIRRAMVPAPDSDTAAFAYVLRAPQRARLR